MTSLTRRHFFTFAAGTLAATACQQATASKFSEEPAADLAWLPPVGDSAEISPVDRMLNRAGYGAPFSERQRANRLGLSAYLNEQLEPDAISDTEAEARVDQLLHYNQPVRHLIDLRQADAQAARGDLVMATLLRATLSKRQLYEAMVEFWSDHFHIYVGKSRETGLLKLIDDREVIRPNALGTFRDLLYASATSPAMLLYLDNARSSKRQPNENYARELLELHTLGVNGGYSEMDVRETARVLTGWGIERLGSNKGQLVFRPALHDSAAKELLGVRFPAGQGEGDLVQLVDLLATHPSTATFIATKLVRRFVADLPPAALVERVAQTFLETGGDVKALLRVIFLSDEFATAPAKLKRPYSYFVSILRTLGIEPERSVETVRWLQLLGQVPFSWPAPNGYPDASAAWSNALLPRWNYALTVARTEVASYTATLDAQPTLAQLESLILTMPLDEQTRGRFEALANSAEPPARTPIRVALLLAHPSFQTA